MGGTFSLDSGESITSTIPINAQNPSRMLWSPLHSAKLFPKGPLIMAHRKTKSDSLTIRFNANNVPLKSNRRRPVTETINSGTLLG